MCARRCPAEPSAAVRGIGPSTAISILVSNMIGTGVFTSVGFQVAELRSGFTLLSLWLAGGLVALCGAAAYAELGTRMPRSGGEYIYLSRIYHPFVGFLAVWVSMTVGFAAPIALATTVELALILTFIGAGLRYADPEPLRLAPTGAALREIASPGFAVSLIFVSYAVSGWNAAGYVAGEIRDPRRVLPLALGIGTALLLTGSFERVMAYAGFTLNAVTLMAVAGLFLLRRREPAAREGVRTWGYPITPTILVLASI